MIEFSHKAIHDKIIQYAALKDKRILEIGCGNGRISTLIGAEPCSLIAIDPDEKAIGEAKQKNSDVDFRVGSGEKLSFPDNYFDIILFTLSLHHQNSQKALQEAERTLKKNGQLLIIEPVIDGEIELVFSFVHNENKEKKDAQKSIEHSNFNVVDSEIFSTDWEFSNKSDLINSIFLHYDKPVQADIAQKIIACIGSKIDSTPIVLQDRMIIQSLKLSG